MSVQRPHKPEITLTPEEDGRRSRSRRKKKKKKG